MKFLKKKHCITVRYNDGRPNWQKCYRFKFRARIFYYSYWDKHGFTTYQYCGKVEKIRKG